jgi:MFS family permease
MTTAAGDTRVAPTTREPAKQQPYAVLRWLTLATFVVILNETLMINAIPRLMGQFDVTARTGQWLSTAFMLTMAVVIPVTGWFLQRVTPGRPSRSRWLSSAPAPCLPPRRRRSGCWSWHGSSRPAAPP